MYIYTYIYLQQHHSIALAVRVAVGFVDLCMHVEEQQPERIYTDGLQYKGNTCAHAQGTDPRVALGA